MCREEAYYGIKSENYRRFRFGLFTRFLDDLLYGLCYTVHNLHWIICIDFVRMEGWEVYICGVSFHHD